MICPLCKSEIKDDSKFCNKCGKKIPRCPTCGEVIQRPIRFCLKDGTPIPDDVLQLFEESSKKVPKEVPKEVLKEHSEKKPKKPPKKKAVYFALAGVLMLFLIAGGVLAVWFIRGGSQSEGGTDDKRIAAVSEEDITDESDTEDEPQQDVSAESESIADEDTDGEVMTTPEPTEPETTTTPKPTRIIRVTEQTQTPVPTQQPSEEIPYATTQPAANSVSDPVVNFILNSDHMYLSNSDLEGFDAGMCRLARNGIYARVGRKFDDDALTEYFEQFDWYQPTIEPGDFEESYLNTYQVANRDLIVAYEGAHGY